MPLIGFNLGDMVKHVKEKVAETSPYKFDLNSKMCAFSLSWNNGEKNGCNRKCLLNNC